MKSLQDIVHDNKREAGLWPRHRYECGTPGCGTRVWGEKGENVHCGSCERELDRID